MPADRLSGYVMNIEEHERRMKAQGDELRRIRRLLWLGVRNLRAEAEFVEMATSGEIAGTVVRRLRELADVLEGREADDAR